MPSKTPHAPNERKETDESLLHERKKADDELHKQHAKVGEHDPIVIRARGLADEVLGEARERADETLDKTGSSEGERDAVLKERKLDDDAIERERAAADERSNAEFLERKRALTKILRLEREQTDERLLVERARADAALEARDDFMSMVSHDVRSLLGSIALMSEVQIRQAASDEVGQRSVKTAEKIQRATARINRLIGDLVDVASIEAGRFAVVPQEQDANALIRDSIEAFEPAAAAKDMTLSAPAANTVLPARFDHDRLLQVLANLLSNAIKFSKTGGDISLRAERVDSEVRFFVTDTGAGVAQEQLHSIFERFWQVTKNDQRGLGLGLFISKCIVDAHGGRIWAESTLSKGSTFCFTLPG